MSAQFVTRCPKCSTTFKVTTKQLQIAKGAVRCGACLHVFRATENIVPQTQTASVVKPNQPAKKASVSSENNKATSVQAKSATNAASTVKQSASNKESELAYAGNESAQQAPLSSTAQQTKPKPAPDSTSFPFDEQIEKQLEEDDPATSTMSELAASSESSQQSGSKLLLDDDEDLLISDDMDFDDDEEENPLGLASDSFSADDDALEIDERFLSMTSGKDNSHFEDDFEEISQPSSLDRPIDKADESWAEALLEEVEEDDKEESKSEYVERYDDDPENFQFDEASDEPFAATEPRDKQTLNAKTKTQQRIQPEFEPEPIELSIPKNKNRLRLVMWLLLIFTTGATLVGQYTYFNFNELARSIQWRPILGDVCGYLDCKLPSLVTPEKIKTNKLLVRSHPEVANVLIVDALFTNTAEYQQPFPIIELTFSDRNDQITATRRFAPIEYLKGEMTGLNEMPSQTPIHISLAIKDPGAGSENYRLKYLPQR